MKIVVTGHNGFVGAHLLPLLGAAGHEVLGRSIADGFDVERAADFDALPPFDVMVHMAARSFVPDSYKEPAAFYRTNVLGTLNALEACRKAGARMVFMSSYVYGRPQSLPIAETHALAALNPYGESKIIGEQLCQGYHRDFGVPCTILRPFNIYGGGQGESFLLPTILKQVATGRVKLQDPRPKRDYVHVADVAAAIAAACSSAKSFAAYNVASGISTSIQELISILQNSGMLPAFEVEFSAERRPNEVLDTVADISAIKKDLGWEPKKKLAEELPQMATQYLIPA